MVGELVARKQYLPDAVHLRRLLINAWYATIHFGRPLGETISSLVGGYVLGVLALSTRSIWGGLFIHIGVAWLMEAAAFW